MLTSPDFNVITSLSGLLYSHIKSVSLDIYIMFVIARGGYPGLVVDHVKRSYSYDFGQVKTREVNLCTHLRGDYSS